MQSQPVVAARTYFTNSSCSLNASAGVIHPRVFLGLVFSAWATA